MKNFILGFAAALIFVALVFGIYMAIGGNLPGGSSRPVLPVQPVKPVQPMQPANPVNPQ